MLYKIPSDQIRPGIRTKTHLHPPHREINPVGSASLYFKSQVFPPAHTLKMAAWLNGNLPHAPVALDLPRRTSSSKKHFNSFPRHNLPRLRRDTDKNHEPQAARATWPVRSSPAPDAPSLLARCSAQGLRPGSPRTFPARSLRSLISQENPFLHRPTGCCCTPPASTAPLIRNGPTIRVLYRKYWVSLSQI